MTHQHVAQKKQHSKRTSPQNRNLFQRIAIHSTPDPTHQPPQTSRNQPLQDSQFHHNFSQLPIHTPTPPSIQKKATSSNPQNYQIASSKPSEDGYREITAVVSGTNQQIGTVKIKGSPTGEQMQISSLWVDPDHRRRGISKSLIAAATAEGKKQGYRKAKLGVDPEAPGMNTQTLAGIYGRQGFKKSGIAQTGQPLMETHL